MHRWSALTRLFTSTSQWRAVTTSIPRCPAGIVTSRVARASSSSSFPLSSSPSSTSSTSSLEHPKRPATSHVSQSASHSCPSHLTVAMERGAYDERTMHVTRYSVQSLVVVEGGKHVQITWEDGKVSRFHSLWLRHTCFCSQCKFDGNGQPKMAFDLIPSDLLITSAVDDGEGSLVVHWKGEGEESHQGVFPLKFLKFFCYSKESLQEKREAVSTKYTTEKTIPEVTYEEVMGSEKGVLRWVTYLNERGICLVKGIPPEPGMGRTVSERITQCALHTQYGFVQDVIATPTPINAAFSSAELKLHFDLVYYAAPPGIRTLFCVRFDEDIEGGESEYADLFHVADTFRQLHPQDFNVLATVPATIDHIHYDRDWPVHYIQKRTIIVLNGDGDLVGVRHQPHHLGPLQVPEEFIEPFYAAYKKFYSLIGNWPYKLSYRLRPGDMMCYNNRRMAHARNAFIIKEGQQRFLQGCSLDESEFKSRVQSLSNLIGDGRLAHRVGDNDLM